MYSNKNTPIEHLINELDHHNLEVAFTNSHGLNLVKSTLINPKINTIKASQTISSYREPQIVFRKRGGYAPKDSLSVYWHRFRLYSQFDSHYIETYGVFKSEHIPSLTTVLQLLEAIKERWVFAKSLTPSGV